VPTFSPPAVYDVPRVTVDSVDPGRQLFKRYSALPRGRSVLHMRDGSFIVLDNPTGDQIAAALFAYIGGHIYDITDAEAALLVAAGFEVEGYGGVPPGPSIIDALVGTIDGLAGTIQEL